MQITTDLRDFIIANYYIPSEIDLDSVTSLLDDGIIDSTGVLELVSFVESRFGIAITDEDLLPSNFDSLHALTKFVETKVEQP